MNKFWIVVPLDGKRQAIKPFTTYEKAREEAMKLTTLDSHRYYVLEAKTAFKTPPPLITETVLEYKS